ncbi:MAG TPA: ABC transporter permease [Candidatus Limnocylindria bacterium]|jgi:ribose transport system permease protein|nr:ABC transporter permease [Candidatus Limnocylindria bacterium]
MISARQRLASVLRQYGMAGVLVLLCAFFSAVTIRDQQLSGADAADNIAGRISPLGKSASVLVIARGADEDQQFTKALKAKLEAAGLTVVGVVAGEPRDARKELQRLNDAGTRLSSIATTSESAAWTVLADLAARFPALGTPVILSPQASRWPVFLTRQNLLNVANQIVVVAILSAGLTFVILTGGIDLSVGSLIALAAVVATRLVRDHLGGAEASGGGLLLAAVAGLGLCALIGLASGAVIVRFNLPSFIVTLAVMQAASGLAFILAKGQSIYEMPDSSAWLGRGTGLFGLPHAVVLMLLVFAAAHILLTRTVLGRDLYAVGGNEQAARLSGVPVGRVKLFAYAACAALAGLGGIVMASQLKSGAPTYGTSYELYAIAAVVVGGTSLTGGQGNVIGTLVGALIIAAINNGMNLTGVESYTQKVVLGLVILGAVLLDRLKARLGPGR